MPQEALAEASRAAEVILRAYPQADARATEDFVAELTKLLASLSPEELGWVMDLREGVRARCKFLPTPADIMEVVREKAAARASVMASEPKGYQRIEPSAWTEDDRRRYLQPRRYRPFPKLFDRLEADGDEALLLNQTFDALMYASRELAIHGPDAAKAALRRNQPPSLEALNARLEEVKAAMPSVSDASPRLKAWLAEGA